jgi:hypothetical protein
VTGGELLLLLRAATADLIVDPVLCTTTAVATVTQPLSSAVRRGSSHRRLAGSYRPKSVARSQ